MRYRHMVVYPSADPRVGLRCADEWASKGYEVLIGFDADKMCAGREKGPHLFCLPSPWAGYYGANGINMLVREAFRLGADLVTAIGDDMVAPIQGAALHADMYFARFSDGFGIMQCTGDRQGDEMGGTRNADRICGSPTFGRAWSERAFAGSGGFPVGYHSFYADEVLKIVAERIGLLYQERALNLEHLHWSFHRSPKRWWHESAQQNWMKDRETFEADKRSDFKRHLEWRTS